MSPDRSLVGAPLLAHCIVTYDPRRANVRGLEIPEYGDQVFYEQFYGPSREQVEVDGLQMVRLTWTATLYPRAVGPLHLKGIAVEYGVVEERRGGLGGMFSWAFSREEQLHKTRSNDVAITIEPLPASKPPIDVVGLYRACRLRVDRSAVAEGEAIALTVELQGTGNAGFMPTFSPSLPQGTSCYRDGATRTGAGAIFKFVMQCNTAGSFTIPAQRFVCYDPIKREKYVVASEPLGITVSPRKVTNTVQSGTNAENLQDEDEAEREGTAERGIEAPTLLRRLEIPPRVFWALCLFLLLAASLWQWRGNLRRVLRALLRRAMRLVARLWLVWAAWRGTLTVRMAYAFFLEHTNYEVADERWQAFWLVLQGWYFGGQADAPLGRSDAEQVRFWARRLASRCDFRIKLSLFLLCAMGSLCAAETASEQASRDAAVSPLAIAMRVRELRATQRYASFTQYGEIEAAIGRARPAQAGCLRYLPFIARMCHLSHLLPFLVWQLLFLCGLLLFLLRRLRLWGLLVMLLVGFALLFATYERSERWRVLVTQTPLYLGPGSGYPISKGLVPGDEVRVINRAPVRATQWIYLDACGEKGWLPHDAVI
ncbi:MAG: BatD family protein [Candidatus Dependentiae bacterium]|nr:BatD family protein [Candidatus Dependentiae bacterium]